MNHRVFAWTVPLALGVGLLGMGCVSDGSSSRGVRPAQPTTDAASIQTLTQAQAGFAVAPRSRRTRVLKGVSGAAVIGPTEASGFHVDATGNLQPRILGESSSARRGAGNADLVLPGRANGMMSLTDRDSAAQVRVGLQGTSDAVAKQVRGYVVYPAALRGADVIHRVVRSGTEDFVLFHQRPREESVSYSLVLGDEIKGLRLIANSLEMLDASGTPRLRMAAPYLVDSSGRSIAAKLAVHDCAVDASPAAPWGRPTTPPGNRLCTATVTWQSGASYPVLLDPAWTTTGSMATARMAPAAVKLSNGRILVAGGADASSFVSTNAAEMFDPASGTWATIASMATERSFAGAAMLGDGRVLVSGGYDNSTAGYTATCEIYDPSSGAWSATGALSTARAEHSLNVLGDGRAVAAGGTSASQTESSTEIWSGGSWTSGGAMSGARSGHRTAALANGKLLAVGGADDVTASLATAELFDPSSNTWSATGTMGAARYYGAIAVLNNGNVLMTGGADTAGNAIASAEVYNAGAGSWTATGSMSASRYSMSAIPISNNRVLVSGGLGTSNALSSAEVYSAASGAWSAAPSLSTATETYVGIALNDGRVLVAGGAGVNSTTVSGAQLALPADVSTDGSSYAYPASVTVSFGNMSGSAVDFVTLAPPGSSAGTITRYWYTGGGAGGSYIFSNVQPGTYVARAYFANGSTIEAESAQFQVTGSLVTTVTTDKASYATTDTIVVSYTNMPGYYYDFVTIAPQGSAASVETRYAYTHGVINGSASFSGIAAGTYVARAYYNNGNTVQAESAPFTISGATQATVTTDGASYTYPAQVTVSWSGMPGYSGDYVTVAPQGSPAGTETRYAYTSGALSGSATFSGLLPGTYVARAFFNDGSTIQAESSPFVMGGTANTTVAPDKSSYSSSDTIVLTYSEMAGYYADYVTIEPSGSPAGSHVAYAYTKRALSGTASFTGIAQGTYVARAYFNDGLTIEAESGSFVVGP